MLAAEDSTIVPQKDDHGRPLRPKRSQPHLLSFGIGQRNLREAAAKALCHPAILFVIACSVKHQPSPPVLSHFLLDWNSRRTTNGEYNRMSHARPRPGRSDR